MISRLVTHLRPKMAVIESSSSTNGYYTSEESGSIARPWVDPAFTPPSPPLSDPITFTTPSSPTGDDFFQFVLSIHRA